MALPTSDPDGGGTTSQEDDQKEEQERSATQSTQQRASSPAQNRAVDELQEAEQRTSPNKGSNTPAQEFRNTSNPSPDRGGRARSPTTNQEPQEQDSQQTESAIQDEQQNTPTSGGVAGRPGSGTTVEPENRGQLDAVKERVAESSDDLDKDDLRITGDRQGRVGFELTEDAKEERQQRFLEKNRGKIEAVGSIYAQQPKFRTREERGIEPSQQDLEAQIKALDNKRGIAKAEQEAETESFSLTVPEFVPGIGGRVLGTAEGQARELNPVQNADGSVSFEQGERFDDDIDWSRLNDKASDVLGFDVPYGGDPAVDEVEQFYKGVQASAFEAADTTGKLVAGGNIERDTPGPEGQLVSDLDEGELAPPGTLDESMVAEEPLEIGKAQRTAQGAVTGIASAPAIAASLPVAVMEGTELGVKGVEETASGDLDEFSGEVKSAAAGSAAGSANAAAANPYRTGGMLAGSLVGTGGVFKAASKVGPKTSAATRYTLQPGEELLGAGGFRATQAVGNRVPGVEGEAAAQRLFPNKEPLLFSEEAAIRGAKRAGAATRSATKAGIQRGRMEATSARFRTAELFSDDVDFRLDTGGSDRGQASLIPRGRQKPRGFETETETEVESESDRLRSDAESSDVEVDSAVEGRGRLFETTTTMGFESTDLLSDAQTQQADTGTESLPGSELDFETDLSTEFETEQETETKTEVETEQRQELGLEFETEQETRAETELEFETEVEFEHETETEPALLDPVQGDDGKKKPTGEEFSKVFENPSISPEEILGGDLDESLKGLD